MPKSILLADDSLTIQKVIELTFSDTDYELTTVGNGLEAIASINRSRPDLVMADVVMPGKNGYEVCETIKSNPALADIPVILLSGTFEPFDRERAERAKANAIVTKPFDSKNLLSQVEVLLTSRSSPTTVAVPVSSHEPPAAFEQVEQAEQVEEAEEAPLLSPSAETVQIPSSGPSPRPPDSGEYRPPWMGAKSVEEIAEMTFDGASDFREPPPPVEPETAQPEEPKRGGRVEPVEFDMDDSSPFGKPVPATPFAQERPLHEVFSPFPERDNVFEFPGSEPPAPEPEIFAPAAKAPAPEDVTQEIPPLASMKEEGFAAEPIFLQPSEPEPAEEAVPPRAAVESDIESLAQSASISDLVSRVSGPAVISDEDVDRIARRVVEMIADKAVREIAWEVVPDMAEVVVRKRLRELEAESGEPD